MGENFFFFYVLKSVIQIWKDTRVNKWWLNINIWVNYTPNKLHVKNNKKTLTARNNMQYMEKEEWPE